MKIVIINVTYGIGSTGTIVKTLYNSYMSEGHDVRVIYGRASDTKDNPCIIKGSYDFESKICHALSLITGDLYGGMFFSTVRIIRLLKRMKPDAVHIHCANGYFVNIGKLIRYLKNNHIKTILTNHAEFFYTGNCGYSLKCNNWINQQCKGCKRVREFNNKFSLNLTHKYWKRMHEAFQDFEELVVTSVSPWLNERSKQSEMLNKANNICVLNPVTHHNACIDETIIREQLSIPKDNKVILHVTANFYNPEKGGSIFLKLISDHFISEKVTFIVKSAARINEKKLNNVIYLDDRSNIKVDDLYRMADCTLLLSTAETFSMVTAESLCNGTPVVGFLAGGPESIGVANYCSFVEYGDVDALINELRLFLSKNFDRGTIQEAAVQKFDERKIANQYLTLMKPSEGIISANNNKRRVSKTWAYLFSSLLLLFFVGCVATNTIPALFSTQPLGIVIRGGLFLSLISAYAVYNIHKKTPPNILNILFAIIWSVASIGSLFLNNFSPSFTYFSNTFKSILFPFCLLIFCSLFIRSFVKEFTNGKKLIILLICIYLLSFMFAIYSICDQIVNTSLAGDYLYNPNRNFNGYVLIILFSLLFSTKYFLSNKKLCIPMLFLLGIAILATFSKTAILGLLVIIITYFIATFKKHKVLSIVVFSATILLIVSFIILMNIPDFRKEGSIINILYESIYFQVSKTIRSRIDILSYVFSSLIDWKLLIGYGYGFSHWITQYYIDNHYLFIIFSSGLIGLMAIIFYYYKSIRRSIQILKANKEYGTILILVNIFIIISGFATSVGPFSIGIFSTLLFMLQFTMPIIYLKQTAKKGDIRVLHIVNSFSKGGTEAFILNYANVLKPHGIIFDVYCCGKFDCEQVKTLELSGGAFYQGALFNIKNLNKAFKTLNHFLETHIYDIIHLNGNFDNWAFSIVANLNYTNKIICHSHDTLQNTSFNRFRKIMNDYKRMIMRFYSTDFNACSLSAGYDIIGRYFFAINGTIVPNIINIDRYTNPDQKRINQLKQEFSIKGNPTIFGNITRFENKKNQSFILDVFDRIHKINNNSLLILGGTDGGKLSEIKEKISKLQLEKSVILIGPRNDIPECLSLLDYYLFPSLFEGFGISLLETQLMGVTTISSKFVPENVDLKIGLLHKLNLKIDEWVDFIIKLKKPIVSLNERLTAMDNGGFTNYKTLENIYISD